MTESSLRQTEGVFGCFSGFCSHFPSFFSPKPPKPPQKTLTNHQKDSEKYTLVLVYLSSFLLLKSILIMIRSIGRMIKIHLSSQSFPAHEPRSRFRDPLLLFFSARQRRPQRDVGNVQNEQTENHPVRGVF